MSCSHKNTPYRQVENTQGNKLNLFNKHVNDMGFYHMEDHSVFLLTFLWLIKDAGLSVVNLNTYRKLSDQHVVWI